MHRRSLIVVYVEIEGNTYSGSSPGGMTILQTSEISLYFMIRSLEVVAVNEGEAFTSINQGFRLSSMMILYLKHDNTHMS